MVLTSVGLMAQSGTYAGLVTVVVGGTYTYTCDNVSYDLKFTENALSVTIHEHTLTGTVIGDLTLGDMVVDNLTFDDAKGGYYRDYINSDVYLPFVAVLNGDTTMNNNYYFQKVGNILVTPAETGYHIVNNMQPGVMPFPLVSTSDVFPASTNVYGFAGSGTEADPYQISSADDFVTLSTQITADHRGTGEYFKVMNDIDFGEKSFPNIAIDGIIEGKIKNTEWGFEGHILGNHATITGVKQTVDASFQSLFSVLGEQGSISDLVFGENNVVSSKNYAAPFAALSAGTISNCTNYAEISASVAFAGGICGHMIFGKGTIENCTNYGTIRSNTYATGIVAGSQSGSDIESYDYVVRNCKNYGLICTNNGTGAAGIAGSMGGKVISCTNYGTVRCVPEGQEPKNSYTGGIVSCANRLISVEDCINEGEVYGCKMVGGIIGNDMKGDDGNGYVINCTNKGAVTGTGNYIAGVAGNTARVEGTLTLKGCRNEGVVTAPDTTQLAGNLRGESIILLENCTIAEGLAKLPQDPESESISEITRDVEESAILYDVMGRAITRKQGLVISNGRVTFVH